MEVISHLLFFLGQSKSLVCMFPRILILRIFEDSISILICVLGLRPNRNYSFIVTACTLAGCSSSWASSGRTLQDAPHGKKKHIISVELAFLCLKEMWSSTAYALQLFIEGPATRFLTNLNYFF